MSRAGIVEAVGSQVTYLRPGDHVVGCLTAFCGECEFCLTGRMYICAGAGLSRDASDTSRLSRGGRPVSQFVNLSGFAEQLLVHERALGWRNAERKLPLQTDTVMYAASTTKLLFAYAMMTLVDDGRLDLDRSIGEILPKPLSDYDKYADLAADARWRRITPRMLLAHTAGFPNFRFWTAHGFDEHGKLTIEFGDWQTTDRCSCFQGINHTRDRTRRSPSIRHCQYNCRECEEPSITPATPAFCMPRSRHPVMIWHMKVLGGCKPSFPFKRFS